MTPVEFKTRLQEEQARSGLTVSDLAVWFERPRSTVSVWLLSSLSPRRGTVFDELVSRLELLEKTDAFPIPYRIRKDSRRPYVRSAFADVVAKGVSVRDPAA